MQQTIYFRADGDYRIGFGHIYRLLSLYNYLRDNFACVLLTRRLPEPLQALMADHGVRYQYIEDDSSSLPVLAKHEGALLVMDGYEFEDRYIQALHDRGVRIVKIDDFFECDPRIDVIINHAPHAHTSHYPTGCCEHLLLGAGYVLLREGFLKKALEFRPVDEHVSDVFVCFGGADPKGMALQVCRQLATNDRIRHIHVISRMHREDLPDDPRIKTYFGLGEEALIEVMEQCQLGIAAPSTVSLELCAVRVPLILVPVEENQMGIYNGLIDKKCGVGLRPDDLGDLNRKIDALTPADLASMREAQSVLIDGRAKQRFIDFFENFL